MSVLRIVPFPIVFSLINPLFPDSSAPAPASLLQTPESTTIFFVISLWTYWPWIKFILEAIEVL